MIYIPTVSKSQYVPGIYIIESKRGKAYVGSSVKVKSRYLCHYCDLKNNNHDNKKLQNYFNKNNDLTFRVLEICSPDKLIEREQFYIDLLNPYFNICKVAGATYGNKPWLGKNHSQETKEKIKESNIKTWSLKKSARWEKRNANISARMKGNKLWLGRKHKEDTIKNRTGNLNPNSKKVVFGNIIFTTVKEAAGYFGVGSSAIVNSIKRGNKINGKHSLKYG